MIDAVIWWTGASVLASIGLLGAAVVVTGISVGAVFLGARHLKRLGNLQYNLRAMAQWDSVGRPEWRQSEGTFKMVPTRPTKPTDPQYGDGAK